MSNAANRITELASENQRLQDTAHQVMELLRAALAKN